MKKVLSVLALAAFMTSNAAVVNYKEKEKEKKTSCCKGKDTKSCCKSKDAKTCSTTEKKSSCCSKK